MPCVMYDDFFGLIIFSIRLLMTQSKSFRFIQQAGVKEVILAVSYRADTLVAAIEKEYATPDFVVKISVENEPLGTAGPLCDSSI
jgi:hypothetical protein